MKLKICVDLNRAISVKVNSRDLSIHYFGPKSSYTPDIVDTRREQFIELGWRSASISETVKKALSDQIPLQKSFPSFPYSTCRKSTMNGVYIADCTLKFITVVSTSFVSSCSLRQFPSI